jgi:hypothetical protein
MPKCVFSENFNNTWDEMKSIAFLKISIKRQLNFGWARMYILSGNMEDIFFVSSCEKMKKKKFFSIPKSGCVN